MSLEAIKDKVSILLDYSPSKDTFEFDLQDEYITVESPFLDANNDYITFYIKENSSEKGLLLTDGYNTLNEFALNDRDIQSNELAKKALEKYLDYYDVEMDDNGSFSKNLKSLENLNDEIHSFITFINEVSHLKTFFDY